MQDMKYSTPLILTKLHRPVLSIDPVPRPRLSEWLDQRLKRPIPRGLKSENKEPDQAGGISMVTMTGQLADQAAFFSVLNALYNMRMPLLSVECICVEVPKGE